MVTTLRKVPKTGWGGPVTHLLRIPYATPISTPQIIDSIELVARDPIASALPRVAWKAPGLLHFPIAPLNLKTPADIEEASQTLQAFSAEYRGPQNSNKSKGSKSSLLTHTYQSLSNSEANLKPLSPHSQETSHGASEAKNSSTSESLMSNVTQFDAVHTDMPSSDIPLEDVGSALPGSQPPAPPSIALRGLFLSPNWDPPNTRYLLCQIIESRPFLKRYRSLVLHIFQDKGLIPSTELDEEPSILVNLMDTTRRLRIHDHKDVQGSERRHCPDFDASDLQSKYGNFSWTGNFELEKLCLSETGHRDVWRDGKFLRTDYRDIACISLPGVKAEAFPPEGNDDEYVPAACTRLKNMPVMPKIISSTATPAST
ncbi:MAG: hypothetical protein Q9180_006282 [Flavoplaca navasiana]